MPLVSFNDQSDGPQKPKVWFKSFRGQYNKRR